jgi:hypothetical protein
MRFRGQLGRERWPGWPASQGNRRGDWRHRWFGLLLLLLLLWRLSRLLGSRRVSLLHAGHAVVVWWEQRVNVLLPV